MLLKIFKILKIKAKIFFKKSIFILKNIRGSVNIKGISDDLSRIKSKKSEVTMKAFVYLPKGKKDVQILQNMVAKVHAEAVVSRIKSLQISKDEMLKTIDEIGEIIS